MIFEEKKIILKNGITAVLKTPEIHDAEQMLDCIKTASGETSFLMTDTVDWNNMTVENEAKWILDNRESDNNLIIACYIDDKIIGSCDITFFNDKKTFHRAGLGIAITKKYWNIGIGSAMFEVLIEIAKEHKSVEILELSFVEGNERGEALYEKFGFEIVARIPDAYKLKNGTYQNKIFMQRYL